MFYYDRGRRQPNNDSFNHRRDPSSSTHGGLSNQEEKDAEVDYDSWSASTKNFAMIPRIELEPSHSPPFFTTSSTPSVSVSHAPKPSLTATKLPVFTNNSQNAAVSSLGASIRAGGGSGLSGIAGIAAAVANQQGKPLNLTNLTLAAQTNARKRPASRAQAASARPQSALFCLSLRNPLRKMCIGIVEWKYPFAFPYNYK